MNGVIVTAVAVCPQKYYCGGGTPVSAFDPRQPSWASPNDNTIKACPQGTWTDNVGARSLAQCSEYLPLLLLLLFLLLLLLLLLPLLLAWGWRSDCLPGAMVALSTCQSRHSLISSCVACAVTPPGYRTVNGVTVPCGDNEFRADWKPLGEATTCTSCGVGVKMTKTDRLVMYDPMTYNELQIEVATSSDDCCKYLVAWSSAHRRVAIIGQQV
jgi:hypothetical protein